MAKIKKIIENGGIQYPATITDAVKNPNNGKTVTEELSELGSNVVTISPILTMGSIDSINGGFITSSTRARTNKIIKNFSINTSSGFLIFEAFVYSSNDDSLLSATLVNSEQFISSFSEGEYMRVTVRKNDNSSFLPENAIKSFYYVESAAESNTLLFSDFSKGVYPIKTRIQPNWELGYYYNSNAEKLYLSENWQSAEVDVAALKGEYVRMDLVSQDGGSAYCFALDKQNRVIWSQRLDSSICSFGLYIDLSVEKLLLSNRIGEGEANINILDPKRIIGSENAKKITKITFLGDSITEGSGAGSNESRYSTLVASHFNAIENNLGIAGTALAKNAYNRENASRFIARATPENLENSSLIVIFGGTNDFSYDIKPIGNLFAEETISTNGRIGSKKIVPPSDTETFAGALHELILAVKANCPNTPIMLVTPINRGRFTYSATIPTSEESNLNGNYLYEFREAIVKIGKYYSIPVLEMDDVRLDFADANIASTYSSDNLHPNKEGHKVISEIMINFIDNMYFPAK